MLFILFLYSCKNYKPIKKSTPVTCDSIGNFIKQSIPLSEGEYTYECDLDSSKNTYTIEVRKLTPSGDKWFYQGIFRYNSLSKNIYKEIMLNDSEGTFVDSNILYNKQTHKL